MATVGHGPVYARGLRKGMKGNDVWALNRALLAGGYLKGVVKPGAVFDEHTRRGVIRLQTAKKLSQSGLMGPKTFKALYPRYDAFGAQLTQKTYRALHQQTTTSSRQARQAQTLKNTRYRRDRRAQIHYTQSAMRMEGVRRKMRPVSKLSTHEDCSSECTYEDWLVGWPDPNGLGYNGQGYCHEPSARLLMADLRWKPAGDIQVGDEIWAFDEHANTGGTGAHGGRGRRYRQATILASFPSMKECVRVTFQNGESHICSADHPWLAQHRPDVKHDERPARWVTPDIMLGTIITRPFMPWEPETSYEAGWLAGMFDGEGSVINRGNRDGRTNGVTVVQAVGPTADRLLAALEPYSFHVKTRVRAGVRDCISASSNGGGLPAVTEFLGRIRPERLISAFTIEGGVMRSQFGSEVVLVEPVGLQEVQSIQTTTGTYFAEGYAVHNTGTMIRHGWLVANPQVGDKVFYGPGRWNITHVAEYIGGGLVHSHGSESGPEPHPINYRPVRQIRRYAK
jgi:hypothetical protein